MKFKKKIERKKKERKKEKEKKYIKERTPKVLYQSPFTKIP